MQLPNYTRYAEVISAKHKSNYGDYEPFVTGFPAETGPEI
jgi:hypothetical protein